MKVALNNGIEYTGMLSSYDTETINLVQFKTSTQLQPSTHLNIKIENLESITLDDSVSTSKFQTDSQISKPSISSTKRNLQKWVPEKSNESCLDLEAEVKDGNSWNQFEVNEKKFGVTTDFCEDLYTTVVDKSRSDFKLKELEASRIANEIEKSTATNVQVAIERDPNYITGIGEEELFSSVIKPKNPIKATVERKVISKKEVLDVSSKPPSGVSRKSSFSKFQKQIEIKGNTVGINSDHTANKLGDHRHDFKPFKDSVLSHIKERKTTLEKEGRKIVLKDFKEFADTFKIPDSFKKQRKQVNKLESKKDVQFSDPKHDTKPSVEVEKSTESSKPTFKLSAAAVEFTPLFIPPPNTVKNYKGKGKFQKNANKSTLDESNGYHNNETNPYYYNSQLSGYYRPMMPGYQPPMPLPGQNVPYNPGYGPPQMYRPSEFSPQYSPNGAPIIPYVLVPGPNGWYPVLQNTTESEAVNLEEEISEGKEELQ